MSLNHLNKYSELTDEQFVLIGKIVVEFSNIDFSLDVILCRLLMTSDFSGRYITERDSIEKILNKISNVIKLHRIRYKNIINDSILSDIEYILKEVKENKKHRNMFAHMNFSRISNDEIFGTGLNNPPVYDSNGDIVDKSVIFSVSELTKIYDNSYYIVSNLSMIINRLPEINEEILLSAVRKNYNKK